MEDFVYDIMSTNMGKDEQVKQIITDILTLSGTKRYNKIVAEALRWSNYSFMSVDDNKELFKMIDYNTGVYGFKSNNHKANVRKVIHFILDNVNKKKIRDDVFNTSAVSHIDVKLFIVKSIAMKMTDAIMYEFKDYLMITAPLEQYEQVLVSKGYDVYDNTIRKVSTYRPVKHLKVVEDMVYRDKSIVELSKYVANVYHISRFSINTTTLHSIVLDNCEFIMYEDYIKDLMEKLDIIDKMNRGIPVKVIADVYKKHIKDNFLDHTTSRKYNRKDFYDDIGVVGEKKITVDGKRIKYKIIED